MSAINQKEYLKKYLSVGSKSGKKKKKKKICTSDRLTIIDDDDEVKHFTKAVEEDLLGNEEDAPQIVGYVDDRPLELKLKDYNTTGMWKPAITNDADVLIYEDENSANTFRNNSENMVNRDIKQEVLSPQSSPSRNDSNRQNDSSLSRTGQDDCENHDMSPPRRRNRHDDEDLSPLRRRCDDNTVRHRNKSPPQRDKENNLSPSRKNMKLSFRIKTEKTSPTRDDLSPPRKRSVREENLSPRRRRRERESRNFSPERSRLKRCDRHRSPIREFKIERRSVSPKQRSRFNSDLSPPRKNRYEGMSPPRRQTNYNNRDSRRDNRRDRNESSSSRRSPANLRYSSRESHKDQSKIPLDQADVNNKLTKTLDGKRAGLQNAEELVKENQAFKRREDDLFNNMSAQVSGVNAAPILRDRKTGRKRNLEDEAEREKEKRKKDAENKEKYDRWGKGLKQVDDYNEKIKQDVYEMSKPLARYADDEDLEKFLKEKEREGDPMLAYIRKKKKKDMIKEAKPEKPQYEGEFMPNRYGIRPGHRWDGVDRSSGYEKKWFEIQNARKASQEDVYKWSTEDM